MTAVLEFGCHLRRRGIEATLGTRSRLVKYSVDATATTDQKQVLGLNRTWDSMFPEHQVQAWEINHLLISITQQNYWMLIG